MGIYDGCPCHGCEKPKRHYGCHSTCPDKRKWDADRNGVKEKVGNEKKKHYTAAALLSEGAEKAMRKRR